MPMPIIPVSKLTEHEHLFEANIPELSLGGDAEHGISSLQAQFLGGAATGRREVSAQAVALLEQIEKSQDTILTVAESLMTHGRIAGSLGSEDESAVFRVPSSINDRDLMNLKAQGLVTGSGRAVSLTDRGRTALRDRYLVSQNHFKANRAKTKYDITQERGSRFHAAAEETARAQAAASNATAEPNMRAAQTTSRRFQRQGERRFQRG